MRDSRLRCRPSLVTCHLSPQDRSCQAEPSVAGVLYFTLVWRLPRWSYSVVRLRCSSGSAEATYRSCQECSLSLWQTGPELLFLCLPPYIQLRGVCLTDTSACEEAGRRNCKEANMQHAQSIFRLRLVSAFVPYMHCTVRVLQLHAPFLVSGLTVSRRTVTPTYLTGDLAPRPTPSSAT